jgi:hypothetical protein
MTRTPTRTGSSRGLRVTVWVTGVHSGSKYIYSTFCYGSTLQLLCEGEGGGENEGVAKTKENPHALAFGARVRAAAK